MLKKFVNECRIAVTLEPKGAVLIKSGNALTDGIDMSFVRTMKDGIQQVYFPGSSLKGVARTHAEALARSLTENKESICNLFHDPKKVDKGDGNSAVTGPVGCSYWVGNGSESGGNPAHARYRSSCPACKLFGSLAYGGRFNMWDAYSKDGAVGTEFRDGVGIDRFTGGAFGGAKFQFEVITSGTFHSEVVIKNFEMWQLAWVLFVLRDMHDELVPIGMGTSRGFGKICLEIKNVVFDFFRLDSPTHIYGIGADQENLKDYGLYPDCPIEIDDSWQREDLLIRQRVLINANQALGLMKQLQPHFVQFLKQLPGLSVERAS